MPDEFGYECIAVSDVQGKDRATDMDAVKTTKDTSYTFVTNLKAHFLYLTGGVNVLHCRRDFSVPDTLTMAVIALLAGNNIDTATAINSFLNKNRSVIAIVLPTGRRIPSHSAMGQAMKKIDASAFESAFANWTESICSSWDKGHPYLAGSSRSSANNSQKIIVPVNRWKETNPKASELALRLFSPSNRQALLNASADFSDAWERHYEQIARNHDDQVLEATRVRYMTSANNQDRVKSECAACHVGLGSSFRLTPYCRKCHETLTQNV